MRGIALARADGIFRKQRRDTRPVPLGLPQLGLAILQPGLSSRQRYGEGCGINDEQGIASLDALPFHISALLHDPRDARAHFHFPESRRTAGVFVFDGHIARLQSHHTHLSSRRRGTGGIATLFLFATGHQCR